MKCSVTCFLDLPWNDIVITKIMPYLLPSDWLNLRAVCKQSNQLVSQYFGFMKHLDLSAQKSFPKGVWEIIVQQSSQIRVLNLSQYNCYTEETIKELAQNNPNIYYVDLSHSSHLRQGSIQPMIINCKKLTVIILKNCPWLTVGALETLSFHFPRKIVAADFSGCSGISETSMLHFIKHQPRLLSLSLSNLACVGDETLFIISQTCNQMMHLDVTRCCRVTDRGIQMIGEYCRNIRSLKVEGCGNVSERSLLNLRARRVQIDKLQFPHYLLYKKSQVPCPKMQL